MSTLATLCLALAGLIQLVLGARLLWLSRRTRGTPEVLWGLTWFFGAVENFSDGVSGALPDTDAYVVLRWIVAVTYPAVATTLYLANWRLFRPQSRWAAGVAIGATALLAGSFIYQTFALGLDVVFAGTHRSLNNWASNIGLTTGLAWAAAETWRYHRMFEKRRRLGMAEPLLPFRYLCWFGSATALTVMFVLLWLSDLGSVPLWLFNISLPTASLIGVSLMWVTFFPPAWLRRRLAQGEKQ